jgi:hypothetical protein
MSPASAPSEKKRSERTRFSKCKGSAERAIEVEANATIKTTAVTETFLAIPNST